MILGGFSANGWGCVPVLLVVWHRVYSTVELFVLRWMDLESVIQSEVSQEEKNKYCMLTHIYGI